jgi:hypothetical protein
MSKTISAESDLRFWRKSQLQPKPSTTKVGTARCYDGKREGRMDWDDYLRDQAANYLKLAETADDPLVKQEHFELAAVCEEVANSIGDRLSGG